MSLDEIVAAAVRDAIRAELPPAVRDAVREAMAMDPTAKAAPAKLTTGRAAKMAGVSGETIRSWASRGRFPCARDGATGRIVIDRVSFERFLADREQAPAPSRVDISIRARSIVSKL